MRVLVTGATGFIGSSFCRELVAAGQEVVGLSRDPVKAAQSMHFVEFHAWQPEGLPPLDVVASADAVVNLAGETVAGRWTKTRKQRIFDSRIAGTRNIVSAMRQVDGPKILVNASAVGYYGNRGDETLDENASIGGGFLAEVCEAWEGEAMLATEGGIRAAVMRTGIVLGRGGGALKPMLPLFRFGLGGPLAGGKQWWPWVHLDDVIGALRAAVEQPYEGIYNLTAPNPVRQKDFAKTMGRVLGRPALMPAPGFALRLAQGEFADEIVFSKRVLPRRLQTEGFEFRFPQLEAALADVLGKQGANEDVFALA
jgi:uncharacterized protein (TIGR01777 family)